MSDHINYQHNLEIPMKIYLTFFEKRLLLTSILEIKIDRSKQIAVLFPLPIHMWIEDVCQYEQTNIFRFPSQISITTTNR